MAAEFSEPLVGDQSTYVFQPPIQYDDVVFARHARQRRRLATEHSEQCSSSRCSRRRAGLPLRHGAWDAVRLPRALHEQHSIATSESEAAFGEHDEHDGPYLSRPPEPYLLGLPVRRWPVH